MNSKNNSEVRTNVNKAVSINEKWETFNKLNWSQTDLKLRQMITEIVSGEHGILWVVLDLVFIAKPAS